MSVHCGDARAVPLADGTVNLVVTSPPYFGPRTYGELGEIGGETTPADYVKALIEVLGEMARVLAADGSVFLVIGDKYARTGGVDRKPRGTGADPGGRVHSRPVQRGVPGVRDGSLVGLPFRVALAAVDAGWVWRQEIVWHKPNPLPESVRTRCVRSHETILHLARTHRPYAAPEREHDVWDIAVAGYRDPDGARHPAVFPEALVAKIVTGYSRPGDLVLDPFAGSGTTVKAARDLGREAVGVELNPEYVAVARRRLA